MTDVREYAREPLPARAIDGDDQDDGIRRFWIAFTLAVITSFGVCSAALAVVAAGLALFS